MGTYDDIKTYLDTFETDQAVRVILNAQFDTGSTPLFTACWYRKREIVPLLVKYGANINITNSRGNRAIHMALEKNQEDIVRFLLMHGAEINLDEVKNIKKNLKANQSELSPDIEEIIREHKNVSDESTSLRELQKKQTELKSKLKERENEFSSIHAQKKN